MILASHLGRPKGKPDLQYTLQPVAKRLSELLGQPVGFAPDCVGPAVEAMTRELRDGDVLLLENLRFHAEEEKNDPAFSKQLAALCDVYINDAFGTAHRAHASTAGITAFVRPAAAGFLMQKELECLGHALGQAEKPYVSIVGGSKVSDKIELIENFLGLANQILIGGAMAYTFLRAKGIETGKSLVEVDKIDLAKDLMSRAASKGVSLELPVDHVVAASLEEHGVQHCSRRRRLRRIRWDSTSVRRRFGSYSGIIAAAKTIVWNGPMGVFENPLVLEGHVCDCPRGGGFRAHSRLSGAATPRRRWRSREWNRRSRISPPEAARRWNFFPDRSCPVWKP